MPLSRTLCDIWNRFQGELFPALAEELGPLTENHRRRVAVLDFEPVETYIHSPGYGRGRPLEDRRALARSFIAKAIWDLPTTRANHAGQPRGIGSTVSGVIRRCDPTVRSDGAPFVWLGACCVDSERGDVFAGVCRVCRDRFAGADARRAGGSGVRGPVNGPVGGSYRPGFNGD